MESRKRLKEFKVKKDSLSGEKTYFVLVGKEWVQTSREVFRELDNSTERELYRKRMERRRGDVSYEYLPDFLAENKKGEELAREKSAEEEFFKKQSAETLKKCKKVLALAIRTLEKDERDLILAVFYKNKSYRTYAAEKNISIATVYNRMQKVLKKLRKCISEYVDVSELEGVFHI